jgi:hypothetical protein
MATPRHKVELTIMEKWPAPMSYEEHERRTDAALDSVSDMAYKAINRLNEKEGKPLITYNQARESVLYWSRSVKSPDATAFPQKNGRK